MSPFTVSREFTCEKEIQASYEDVLRFIQDPFKLCIQNPLITSVVKDETDPQLYTITDRLSIVGPLTTSTTYRAKIVSIEGGVTTETEAALGTRLRSRFIVERGLTNDTCVLKEVTSVEALFILMPYVFSTMSKAHMDGMDSIAQRAAVA